jgi:hypothetical protein
MVLFDLITMHKYFIMKPNPYIPDHKAEATHRILAVGEAGVFISAITLSLSLFKIMPSITLNSAYKRFTVVQFLISFGILGYYGYQLHNMKNLVPV